MMFSSLSLSVASCLQGLLGPWACLSPANQAAARRPLHLFLLANLATGAVNNGLDTLKVAWPEDLAILVSYGVAVLGAVCAWDAWEAGRRRTGGEKLKSS